MGFDRTELPSGIRVVSERMPGQRSVAVGAWVGTGSRDEPAELSGVTHFLEHLVFKGTPSRSALDIAQSFDAMGGDLNAFTTKEFTCFHARTLHEDLSTSVETIADMLQHALLAPADLEAERNVVLEEIAMHEDTPDDIVFDLFHETMWPAHPLGRRVQGVAEAVAGMGRGAIETYYRAAYGPRSMVIAAAGDVDHDALVQLVASAFPEDGGTGSARPAAPPPSVAGALCVRRRDIEQAHIVYGTSGVPRNDERRWTLGVLNVALGGGMSSRLFQEIREKRGLAYSVSSGHQGFADTGVFQIYAGCSAENVPEVLRIARSEIDAVAERGITEEERARAAGHLRGSLLLSLDDPGSLMTHLGKSELCLREILSSDEMIARMEAVTLEDVRAVARDVLGGSWSMALLGPAIDADVSGFVGATAVRHDRSGPKVVAAPGGSDQIS